MQRISSWGRLTAEPHEVCTLLDAQHVHTQIKPGGIALGLGRSYGDACLNPQSILWDTKKLDRFIAFDRTTGRMKCEAGVSLKAIQQLTIPFGWALPVSPGTQWVTIGGAIANDIHGKNHHRTGAFGACVKFLRLVRSNGEIIECTPDVNAPWFAATVGGVGLTGIITEVELQLRPIQSTFLETETHVFSTLDEFFELAETSVLSWEYTVAWIDCTKKDRGLFMRANWSRQAHLSQSGHERQWAFPVMPPVSLMNRYSLKLFNQLYFYSKKRHIQRTMHHASFLYPLDKIKDWNRAYGPKGFFQYQCVLPQEYGKAALAEILHQIHLAKTGSSLVVLKTFGAHQSMGMMSFALPGVTFALDFPNEGKRTLMLLERLDEIVRAAKGRIYLAKDACQSQAMFVAGYPRLNEFLKYRDVGMSSGLSKRLIGS